MTTNRITPTGAAVGAALGGVYGGAVAVVHFACSGRWDRGPAFAVAALLLGAALGGLVEVASALLPSPRRTNRGAGPAATRASAPDMVAPPAAGGEQGQRSRAG